MCYDDSWYKWASKIIGLEDAIVNGDRRVINNKNGIS